MVGGLATPCEGGAAPRKSSAGLESPASYERGTGSFVVRNTYVPHSVRVVPWWEPRERTSA